MKPAAKKPQRCAIYTRVSTENGLEWPITIRPSPSGRGPARKARPARGFLPILTGALPEAVVAPARAFAVSFCRFPGEG